ncbi:MAG: hypothetical protein RID53_29700 [Coleofasciculus sp. B1-GNL1-01]
MGIGRTSVGIGRTSVGIGRTSVRPYVDKRQKSVANIIDRIPDS